MADILIAALVALLAWWFSTGALLWIVGLPRATYRWSMAGMTVVAGLAIYGLIETGNDLTASGAYVGFACGLLIWAWHEAAFLFGWITGPRAVPQRAGALGWTRFRDASATIIHHELAIAATAAALVALMWNAENWVGVATFLVLWLMRISAKLNVFLGALNVTEEFLPPHLAYLKSYFRKAPMNPLFPVSIVVSIAVTGLMAVAALQPGATPFETAGYTLLATMTALGLIEHALLMLPFPAGLLWHWGLSSRRGHEMPALMRSSAINLRTVQNTGLRPVVTRAAGRT